MKTIWATLASVAHYCADVHVESTIVFTHCVLGILFKKVDSRVVIVNVNGYNLNAMVHRKRIAGGGIMKCITCSHKGLCTSRVALFSTLPEALQLELARGANHTSIKKGQILIEEGSQCRSIYLIRSGSVKLHRYDLDGKEFILDILTDGDSVGEDLFLTQAPYPYEAVAMSDCGVCEITSSQFEGVLAKEPQAAMNLIASLSGKLQRANAKNAILSEGDALIRVAQFLLERSNRIEGPIEMTIDDIAASISLRRETVSRKIGELQDRGFLKRIGQSKLEILMIDDDISNVLERLI